MPERRRYPIFLDGTLSSAQSSRLGNINSQPRVPSTFYAIFGFALVASIVLVLIFGKYIKHVAASGTIVPADGLLTLKSPITGTITNIYTKSGTSLKKGASIFSIANGAESPTVGLIPATVGQSLHAEMAIEQSTLAALRTNRLLNAPVWTVAARPEVC